VIRTVKGKGSFEKRKVKFKIASMLLLRVGLLLWSLLTFSRPCLAIDPESGALERQVHDLVNDHRQAIGLSPLAYSEEIASIARQHSRDMASGRAGIGHQGAEERSNALLRVAAFKEFAENVGGNSYASSRAVHEAVNGWLNSPSHRRNIEGNFNLTGVGIAQSANGLSFFTQIFLATSETKPDLAGRRHASERASFDETRARRREVREPPRDEFDPRRRGGRKRVNGGWVQEIDPGR
jgi:cysteine-rich secretory family protein